MIDLMKGNEAENMLDNNKRDVIIRETIAGLIGELGFYIDKENAIIRSASGGDDCCQIDSHYLSQAKSLLTELQGREHD